MHHSSLQFLFETLLSLASIYEIYRNTCRSSCKVVVKLPVLSENRQHVYIYFNNLNKILYI
jgi:hypothetical protein